MNDINKKCWDWHLTTFNKIGDKYSIIVPYEGRINTLNNRFEDYLTKNKHLSENDNKYSFYYFNSDKMIIIHKFTIKEVKRILKLSKL